MDVGRMIYYIQVNAISVIILSYIGYVNTHRSKHHTIEDVLFHRLIFASAVYSIADVLCWLCDGKAFYGISTLLYVMNILYACFSPIMAYFWADYVLCKTENKQLRKTKGGIFHVVFVLAVVGLIASSPLTHFAFYINDTNNYVRGIGTYLSPIVAWIYVFGIAIRVIIKAVKLKTMMYRDYVFLVIQFIIPILVATIIQLTTYGLTVTPVGFTISIMIVFVNRHIKLATMDELTGLNNERVLEKIYDRVVMSESEIYVSIGVIEFDNFSDVSTVFGKTEAERGVKLIANALLEATTATGAIWTVARVEKDRFAIVGEKRTDEEFEQLKVNIKEEMKKMNGQSFSSFEIRYGAGFSQGIVKNIEDVEQLQKRATDRLYTSF